MVMGFITTALDLSGHKQNWLIDQNALYCATRAIATFYDDFNIFNLSNPSMKPYVTAAQYLEGGKDSFSKGLL